MPYVIAKPITEAFQHARYIQLFSFRKYPRWRNLKGVKRMILEVVTCTFFGGIALTAKLAQNGVGNDQKKIARIFRYSGLNVKDGKKEHSAQLLKKVKTDAYIEYRYRIPLGRSFADYKAIEDRIQDGLNNEKIRIGLDDVLSLFAGRSTVHDLWVMLKGKRLAGKTVAMKYDGILKIRVYNKPIPKLFPYDSENIHGCKGWQVPVGADREQVIMHDFDKRENVIVAGIPGYGKSTWINTAINTLIRTNPDDAVFTLIDLKNGLELARYKNMKQTESFADTPAGARRSLQDVDTYMEITAKELLQKGHSNVIEAGIKKRHFVVIDEAADISDDKISVGLLEGIARKGRATGVRLIYATQYPTTQTVSSQVKRNSVYRLCFPVDTSTASQVVLDENGAESLPQIKGRAIYKDGLNCMEVQTPYITNEQMRVNIKPHNVKKEMKKVDENPKPKAAEHPVLIEAVGYDDKRPDKKGSQARKSTKR
jgi:DNA segregation ATPase FtsK/SpoIIIE, S-DNA-T family